MWRVSSELVRALDDRLGAPLDGYVNGTQSWLSDDGPGEKTLEWRLHPVGGYTAPRDASPARSWPVPRLTPSRSVGSAAP
jgi:hypothetical protein